MALDWPVRQAGKLVDALVSCGWFDREGEDYRLHDWEDYTGRLSERRRDAERKRTARKAAKAGLPGGEKPPEKADRPQNETQACPEMVRGQKPVTRARRNQTQPNQTKPNQTEPNRTQPSQTGFPVHREAQTPMGRRRRCAAFVTNLQGPFTPPAARSGNSCAFCSQSTALTPCRPPSGRQGARGEARRICGKSWRRGAPVPPVRPGRPPRPATTSRPTSDCPFSA